MSVVICGATVIDGVAQRPIEDGAIWIEGARIKRVCRRSELQVPPGAKIVEASGKYVIPGLMNANVHLLMDIRFENLVRYMGRYEELILEAAQVALKNGITTVFDTYGPRRFLMAGRDRIDAGEAQGSRIFCAGNIIGFDGPFSEDFSLKAREIASAALTKRINSIWVENVGRHLMWLTPEHVATEVRAYIAKGIDFVKYGSNEHFGSSHGAFLAFSPAVQAAIVGEAHQAGIGAQAHTMTVEGLRIAVEAGCDLIQHANHTGPALIPETTLESMARRRTGAVVFPFTQERLEHLMQSESHRGPAEWLAADTNTRNLMRSGAPILLATDGYLLAPEALTDPFFSKYKVLWEEGGLYSLATGHFFWLKAMEEKGLAPMDMLKAATLNIATAYGKDKDLGTLEPGKIADLLVLDRNPIESADHYRSIHAIFKEGRLVDRDALPTKPILTQPMEPPVEEEVSYVPALRGSGLPVCPWCIPQ